MISVDKSIAWKGEYKRNHRSKYQKRIRCFPTHSEIGHQESGFCGQPITINSKMHPEDENDYIVVARFGKFPNDEKSPIKVGDQLNSKLFKYKENVESPFYTSTPKVDGMYINYIVNSNLTPWRYSASIYNRHQLNTLYIYLFKRIDDVEKANMYKCQEIINTPPFFLSTSLKVKRCLDVTENEIKSDEDLITNPNQIVETRQHETEEIVKTVKEEEINKLNHNNPLNIESNNSSPLQILQPLSQPQSFNPLQSTPTLENNNNINQPLKRKNKIHHLNISTDIKLDKFKREGFEPISPDELPKHKRKLLKLKPEDLEDETYTYLRMKNQQDKNKEVDLCRFFKMKSKVKKRHEFDQYGRTVTGSKFLFETPPIYQIDSKGNMCRVNPYPKDVSFSDKK